MNTPVKLMKNSVKPVYKGVYYCINRSLPIVAILKIVPSTAYTKIVIRLFQNARFGIKYPASKAIGGSKNMKKVKDVS